MSMFRWTVALTVLGCGLMTSNSAIAGQIVVEPGDDLRSLVANNPAGTIFIIKSGVHRLQFAVPKDGDQFIGEPGATLSGAQRLTSFGRSGSYWTARVQVTKRSSYRGVCDSLHPMCALTEDLFINNVPLQRTGSLAHVQTGKWFLDYQYGVAYFANDPTGKTVEISVTPRAFYGSAKNVTISLLTIEKYASQAGDGAVHGKSDSGPVSYGWMVKKNIIRSNHGMGVRIGDSMQVLYNVLSKNGQMGIGGAGKNARIEGNEIGYNNFAGYSYNWEAGGTKFSYTTNLIVRKNYSHDNNGPGLWTDIENSQSLYEYNWTKRNKVAGILHEISFSAVIRYNTAEEDGFHPGQTSIWYGAGILVRESSNVQVYGNTVKNCANGIGGIQTNRGLSSNGTPFLLQNLSVHDNVIANPRTYAAGIVKSANLDNSVFTSQNNHFQNDKFTLAVLNGKYFVWLDDRWTLTQWLNYASIH